MRSKRSKFKSGRPCQIRIPKAETRKKAEDRNPNAMTSGEQQVTRIQTAPLPSLLATFSTRLSTLRISTFGLLSDFDLRPSDFPPRRDFPPPWVLGTIPPSGVS